MFDDDWHAFCQAKYKATVGSEWEQLYVVGQPGGTEAKRQSQGEGSLEKEGCKGQLEEFYDPYRADNMKGRNKTRLDLWEERFKDPMVALEKAMQCLGYPQ